jgi:hypothetical protein
MRFDIATLAIALLALLTVPIFARPISTYEVAPAIRELTTIVKTLQKHSHSITLFNAPFIMISQGPFPVGVKISSFQNGTRLIRIVSTFSRAWTGSTPNAFDSTRHSMAGS